jgi:hypothetical protein
MRDENAIMREALLEIRRELIDRSIPLKVCASKAGVSYSTFLSWFPAGGTPQVPSLAALPGLAKALPGDLLSLLVPDGFHVVPDPEGLDYDDFAAGCRSYLDAKDRAHHPESEAGRDLGPGEQSDLNSKIVQLPIMGKVAAR